MNTNDLLFNIAKRARELSNLTMEELRAASGYGCDTRAEAIRIHAGKSRGELIEYNLIEEFFEELPKGIGDD